MEQYSTLKLMIPIALLFCFSVSTARMLDSGSSSISVRMKLEEVEGGATCWESLTELHSCTAEVLLFFLNGETYLGPGCCEAIRIIQHDCWPEMMASLGYNTQEGDLLRNYCDAAVPPPPSL